MRNYMLLVSTNFEDLLKFLGKIHGIIVANKKDMKSNSKTPWV